MNVLIIGGTSFIGNRLKQLLLKQSHHVFTTTRKPCPDKNDIQVDLTDPKWTDKLNTTIEKVVYCAHSHKYKQPLLDRVDLFNINNLAVHQALEWAKVNHVEQFIYLSTGSVYSGLHRAYRESDPIKTNSEYASSKYIGELLVEQYQSYFQACSLRLFCPYGPEQANKLIPNLFNSISNHDVINIQGANGLSINPIYIDDAINYILKALELNLSGTFNIGGKEIVSLLELCTKISTILKKSPDFFHQEEPELFLAGDIEKIINATQLTPSIHLEQGLELTHGYSLSKPPI